MLKIRTLQIKCQNGLWEIDKITMILLGKETNNKGSA